jgi:hypothetical protein
MKLPLRRVLALSLAAAFCASGYAAEDDDIPVEYLRQLDNSISIGMRMRSNGPKVKFGNLGTVPYSGSVPGQSSTDFTRIYDDGYVTADGRRISEDDTTVVNPTYVPDLDGDGDTSNNSEFQYISYRQGQTRTWSYSNPSQRINANTVDMHLYSATSSGGEVEAEGGGEGGFELEFGHTFGKIGKHLEWGFNAGIGLTDINVKANATVRSNLHVRTDRFTSVSGIGTPTIPVDPYTGPTFNPNTSGSIPNAFETTTVLSNNPLYQREDSYANGATVLGNWQIKGAYYLIKLGPSLRYNFNDHIAVSASAGFAGAYVGTIYRVDERLLGTTAPGQLMIQDENETKDFVMGYYGTLNVEYWVTQRTGFFVGVTYEDMGEFKQDPLRERTAKIDIGNGTGFRFGISTRF